MCLCGCLAISNICSSRWCEIEYINEACLPSTLHRLEVQRRQCLHHTKRNVRADGLSLRRPENKSKTVREFAVCGQRSECGVCRMCRVDVVLGAFDCKSMSPSSARPYVRRLGNVRTVRAYITTCYICSSVLKLCRFYGFLFFILVYVYYVCGKVCVCVCVCG